MNQHTPAFIRNMKHPLKFRFFLFFRLPAAFFSGVRVRAIDEKQCVTTVPYKWLTQNPFRSTYFASLSMAAELSTGALAMAHLYKSRPPVSMLVVKMESEFFRKATGRTRFVCEDGDLFRIAVEETLRTGEPRTVRALSTGTNAQGETVASFYITWSFKAKTTI